MLPLNVAKLFLGARGGGIDTNPYVCVHVYVHVFVHVYVHVCVHVFVHVFECTSVLMG